MVPKGSTKMEAQQEEEGGLEEAPALEALQDDGGECRGVAEEWQQPERLPPKGEINHLPGDLHLRKLRSWQRKKGGGTA